MAKPSTTKCGYGSHHQALREKLRPQVEAGVVRCARCGKLIESGAKWELGHVDGSGKKLYSGPEHFGCNRSAGGKLGATITNGAGSRKVSRVW